MDPGVTRPINLPTGSFQPFDSRQREREREQSYLLLDEKRTAATSIQFSAVSPRCSPLSMLVTSDTRSICRSEVSSEENRPNRRNLANRRKEGKKGKVAIETTGDRRWKRLNGGGRTMIIIRFNRASSVIENDTRQKWSSGRMTDGGAQRDPSRTARCTRRSSCASTLLCTHGCAHFQSPPSTFDGRKFDNAR